MFEITWSLSEAEWAKARRVSSEHEAGSEYDRECSAHYYLLYATLAIRSDVSSLFERDGTDAISVSVLDFGYQLVRALVDVERAGRGQISASDDDIEIYFALDGDHSVVIATNHFKSKLKVPAGEFRRACQEFLSAVARSLREHTPKMLSWQSVAPIAAYAPS
jgi:hypothetical protein